MISLVLNHCPMYIFKNLKKMSYSIWHYLSEIRTPRITKIEISQLLLFLDTLIFAAVKNNFIQMDNVFSVKCLSKKKTLSIKTKYLWKYTLRYYKYSNI